MGGFNKFDKGRNGKSFGGGGFGGGRRFGDNSDIPRQMFPATCSQCGQNCEIPFKPTGERPVFCRDCFKAQGGSSREGQNPRFAPQHGGGGHMGGHGGGNAAGGAGGVSKAQFDSLNVKLDKILALLAPAKMESPKAEPMPEPAIMEVRVNKKAATKEKAPAKKVKAKKK